MKLKAWVDRERGGELPEVVYRRLAKAVGRTDKYSWRFIYYIALGRQRPGQDLAVELVKATGGEVGLFDLLPHLKEAI